VAANPRLSVTAHGRVETVARRRAANAYSRPVSADHERPLPAKPVTTDSPTRGRESDSPALMLRDEWILSFQRYDRRAHLEFHIVQFGHLLHCPSACQGQNSRMSRSVLPHLFAIRRYFDASCVPGLQWRSFEQKSAVPDLRLIFNSHTGAAKPVCRSGSVPSALCRNGFRSSAVDAPSPDQREQQAPAQSGWKARTVVSSAPYER